MSNIKQESFEYTRTLRAKKHESEQERLHTSNSHGECLNPTRDKWALKRCWFLNKCRKEYTTTY